MPDTDNRRIFWSAVTRSKKIGHFFSRCIKHNFIPNGLRIMNPIANTQILLLANCAYFYASFETFEPPAVR